MKIKTEVLPADQAESIAKAAELLRSGELVALPTETVYGIAADARNGEAVKKIFVAKGRPQDNPLIVHVTGPEMLPGLVSEVPERAQLLMAAFCPGPLTIIMPRGPEVAAECCAGLDTVGIRMPSHPVARAVIEQSGCAFAAPSANLSGKPSPTNAQDVSTDMDGRLPLILDGGECDWGVESTVVYGGIMNPASALMWAHTINWKIILSYYVTGIPIDLVRALATFLFLWLTAEPLLQKLDRIKTKYALAE